MRGRLGSLAAVALATLLTVPFAVSGQQPQQPQQPMGFFITSIGLGSGGNLGGLAGADAHCEALAAAVGAGARTWRAYLSQVAAGALPNINARDRIGSGPWYNANGQLIASNVADLHGDYYPDRNNIRKPSAVNEKKELVNGVGDMPNTHDMLTGSDPWGRVPNGSPALLTCNNWTSNAENNFTLLGHHDRLGGGNTSWNSVHASAGCAQPQLVQTGGAGLFYCFAAD